MRSSVPTGVSQDRPLRVRPALPILLLTVLGLVIPGLVAPSTAQAADDPGINVEVTKLVKTDSKGEIELDETLQQWNAAKMKGTWDASSLDLITAGTSFSIELPAPFNFRQHPRTDDMTVDYNGTEHKVGECVTEETRTVCTFNEEAERLSRAGFKNFHGTFSMTLTAVAAHSEKTAKFNLNGRIVDVDLPGDEGIVPEGYWPAELTKWTHDVVTQGQTSNTWAVYFGTDYMRDNVMPKGAIKTDGSVSTLVLNDVLAENQVFDWSRANELKFLINRSKDNPNQYQELWAMDGSVSHPDWDVELIRNSDSSVTFRITGPFPESTNMQLLLPVTFTKPAEEGSQYTNTISAEGLDRKVEVTSYYVDSVNVTVHMEPGFGTFSVRKVVDGAGADMVDASATFPLNVDFTLPAHYSTYYGPNWQPPAGFTMDADGVNGHGTLMISRDKVTLFDPVITLPVGTTVTLSEEPNGVQPAAPSTVSWGAPVFSTNTFTIGDQVNTEVQVTNTATVVTPPPSETPTPSETPSQTPTPSMTVPASSTPSVTPKPGQPLAKTGASILVPLLLAGAALGGGSLLVARRRQDG